MGFLWISDLFVPTCLSLRETNISNSHRCCTGFLAAGDHSFFFFIVGGSVHG
jgi:hypothetical protein